MNCFQCHGNINGKSWLHLSNIPSLIDEGKQIHICSYSCYKKLYDSNSLPKNFGNYIVNKEEYKNLIRPIPKNIKKTFEYLSYEEICQLSEEEKEKYYSEKSEQIHINPIIYEIHNEMNLEDKRSAYIESLSTDDEVIYDDY
tara:strand:+ start:116 stop:541 length:426 start_codon:yes stop_codon:yes gene_type:complete